jgi:DNA invertase Pin-like site-specific DNA recombinase
MSKITGEHLSRTACVYVRQSTADQLKFNKESRRLQYALRDRAKELGWHEVTVIDEDLGRSASGTARSGFDRLLASVCRGEIGAIFSVEASRLARTGREWHTLLEFSALVGALIIDNEAIYDPRLSGDRLVLGMKGNMSEMEVSQFRQRSLDARKHKAQRGELFTVVPVGYLRTVDGDHIEKDPDLRIREVLKLIFHKFNELHSVRQVHVWFLQERIDFPWVFYENGERAIRWQSPRYSTVHRVLTNPIYAGAYVFGRRGSAVRIEAGVKIIQRGMPKARKDWETLLKDRYEGYISWEQFEHNQRVISHNNNQRGEAVRGAVRQGDALLPGLLRCRHCGHKLHVIYTRRREVRYVCRTRFHNLGPEAKCIQFGAHRVDEAVAAEVLKVLQPEGVGAALVAIDAHTGERGEQCRQTELAVQQARFESERAKRQFDRVEPENRLVVSELERRWNERLDTVRQLEAKLEAEKSSVSQALSETERKGLLELGNDVSRAWNHPEQQSKRASTSCARFSKR